MTFCSYAQNFEDVILHRALNDISPGFYIDIGAQDPIIDSVSRGFYDLGWRGVHIEPTSNYANALQLNRPDETVLQLAIGAQQGLLKLYEFPQTGLSTGIPDIAEAHERCGYQYVITEVEVITLDSLLNRYAAQDIHWLKIDVEGMEQAVLSGWQEAPQRPWLIVIESTYPGSTTENHHAWEKALLNKGYQFVYLDGINRFYLHEQQAHRAIYFNAPPNVFDKFTLSGKASHSFCQTLHHQIHLAEVNASQHAARAHEANEQLNRRSAELKQQVALLTNQLEVIHQSRSWKLTAPLRAITVLARRPLTLRIRSRLRHFLGMGIRFSLQQLNKAPKFRKFIIQGLKKSPWLYEKLMRALHHQSLSQTLQAELPADQKNLTARARWIHQQIQPQNSEKDS